MNRSTLFALPLLIVSLNAAAQHTYVWPDCDATHPCVVHHIDTVGDGTAEGETLQDFKFPMVPSSPGNLLIFTVMHVSSKSITVTDNNNGNWQTAVTTTNTADGQESDLLYICGAAAGTNLISIHLSQPAVHDEPLHFTYDEVSGIAPTACLDGTAAANGLKGTVQPGPVTTTADGDLIVNYGNETYQYPEYDPPITGVTPDSSSALLMENIVDKYANEVSLQATHGAYTPTLTVNGASIARNWNSVAAAFVASPGAGTQPTGIHVTRILHFVGELTNPVSVPFPSSGNAIVVSTSNDSNEWPMSDIHDNEGNPYTRVVSTNPATDPEIFSTCLGTATGGQNLVISWSPGNVNNHVLFYDIAGAATTGGSTGCVGATVDSIIGFQPHTTDAPMTGDPIITPSTAGSVIVATSYVGTGPPSASLTPGVVFNSIWATGMVDSSSWDTGDPYAYVYTTSTSPISFDWQMANSTTLSSGGTNFDGAAIEILPGPATQQPTLASITVTPADPSIAIGATQQFTATGTYSDTSTKDITSQATWTSTSAAAATISPAGLATAACPGSTTIAAALSNISGQTTLTVTGLSDTITLLSSSANPPLVGQPVTFTAAVSSSCGTPAGTIQFMIDGVNDGAPVALANGSASLSATLASGSHTISAVYSGSSTFATSTSNTLTESVTTVATTTTLIASANTIAEGSSITLTATVTPASGTTAPTGTISFYNGPVLLGTATLTQGIATFTTTTLPGGTDTLTASYPGAGDFAASTSAPVTVTVTNLRVNTTTALSASATQINVGAPVTLTATVAGISGTAIPTGSVSFYSGSVLLGSSPLSPAGVATLTSSTLPAGSDPISVYYAGDTSFNPSVSNTVTITVTAPLVNTTTMLSIVPGGGTLDVGTPYTVTATVTPASGTTLPTGNIVFTIGSITQVVPLNASGVAVYSNLAPAAAGTLAISASYQGSSAFAPSTSNTLNETVVTIATTTAISISPGGGSLGIGASYTVTATVTAASRTSHPSGNVVFTIGSATQTVVLNANGVAVYTGTAPAAPGTFTISAAYQGSATFAASTSSTLNETVAIIATTTAIAVNPGGGSLTVGSPYTVTATVTPASGTTIPTGNVVFTIGTATQTVSLSPAGIAIFAGTAPTAAGTLTIAASYQGSAQFAPSTARGIIATIVAAPTTTTLTTSATQTNAGSPVTLTAMVFSSTGLSLDGGSVSFYDGTTLLGNVPLTAGTASLTTTTLPTGTNPISATYSGTTLFAASASSTIVVSIGVSGAPPPGPTITTMSPLRTLAGSSAFTLTVTGSGFASTSTVDWGPMAMATQFVSATQLTAQIPAASLASPGVTAVTVQTSGLSNSNTFQFELDSAGPGVTPPSFSPTSATTAAGSAVAYTVTLPAGATNVSAQCLNLPSGTTCSYAATPGLVTVATASTTAPGTYPITVVFTETLPISTSAFALLPIVLLPLARRRRSQSLRTSSIGPPLVLLLLMAGAVFVSGCGSKVGTTTASTQTQTQTVTSSAVITLTVQ